jgi:hypothetical protein
MKRPSRLIVLTLLAGATAVVVSCSDRSRGIPAGPDASLVGETGLGSLGQLVGLLSCDSLPYDSVTQTVGPDGGVIQFGAHTLSIPAGALSDSVTITAVAPSDTVRRVQLYPEGLEFATPASLTLSYAGCDLLGLEIPKRVVYTTDLLTILEYLQSVDAKSEQRVRGRLDHFSNYAVAW